VQRATSSDRCQPGREDSERRGRVEDTSVHRPQTQREVMIGTSHDTQGTTRDTHRYRRDLQGSRYQASCLGVLNLTSTTGGTTSHPQHHNRDRKQLPHVLRCGCGAATRLRALL
jgi:hypothetical protein